jgi:YHS domain-containing protein
MIAIRKFGWSVLVLAAFAGCAKEPEPATSPTSDTAPASGTPAPETPPPATTPADTKPEPDKGTTSSPDMPKYAPPAIEAPQPTPATKDQAKPGGSAAAVSLSADEVANIKKLPGAEADQALKQLVCPVSGENLGSMDVPVKVSAAGQTFFLCCKGCSKDVKDDPAAVVAKLKK